VDEVFPRMVQKTLDLHVFPNLAFIIAISCSFDLWMSRGVVIVTKKCDFLEGPT
jgi:hypothetical protein